MRRMARSTFGEAGDPPSALSSLGTGHRRLAARVICLAFRDLENPGASVEDRLSAHTFLAGSSSLKYWCELAQTDPAKIVARASMLQPTSEVATAGRRPDAE